MDRHELLARITTFPLKARVLADDLLSGDYRSVFKGQGMEFDEVRRYEPGDDVRSIDWNVSARFGTPYIKMYREEREMTVCLILDNSLSMRTAGTGDLTRREQGVLAAAMTAFSAEQAGQRTGAVFFDSGISRIFPPRKGRSHTLALITAAIDAPPGEKGTGLGAALTGAERILKRRSLVVVISDFLCLNWEHEMGDISRKHDVIAIRISSPLEKELAAGGLLNLEDPETGFKIKAPASFRGFKAAWAEWHEERRRLWEGICRRSGAARLEISTSEDPVVSLMNYFSRGRERAG